MRAPSPFSPAGATVALLGVVAYVGGWRLGWVELMSIAAGALVALAIAAPYVIGRLQLDVDRTLAPERVMVGESSQAILDIRNPRPRSIRARRIEDSVAGQAVLVELPSIAAGGTHQAIYPLPTERRGKIKVGPAVIARQDPLQLLRREVRQTDADTLWVHPRYTALAPLPVGFAKDLEGPTSDTSPAGDVAFHALREYEPGDDFRHIHWLSTARVGSPMVRHYVDNRKPQVTIVLDDRVSSMAPDEFEVGVEIAASLAVSAMLQRQPVALWSTLGPLLGSSKPGGRDDVLDRLAVIRQTQGAELSRAAIHAVRGESGTSALVIITGDVDRLELALIASQARRHARVVITRMWAPRATIPAAIPGAKLIDAESLDQFVRAWQQVTR